MSTYILTILCRQAILKSASGIELLPHYYHCLPPEDSGKIRPIELADSRLTSLVKLSHCSHAKSDIATRRRTSARASRRGALRRVELKERRPLKKTGSFFPPRGSGAAPGPSVRSSLRARRETFDRILNFVGAARCSGGF